MDRHIKKKKSISEDVIGFVNGGIGGMCGKTAIAPFNRIKFIFMISNQHFTFLAAFKEASDIVRKRGFLKLWRGNTFAIISVFPYAAVVKLKSNFGVMTN
jgi:solute carrier family 25 protein 16